MKQTLISKRCSGSKRQIFAVAAGLLIMSAQARSEQVSQRFTDTILIQKQQVSRRHGIKLYPDANHHVLFFAAKGVYGKAYQLFMFDVEGKLVRQVSIKNKQTTVLENIEKGDYLFEVFSDDERIENGQVIVR
jgi:hypothetical protein